MDIFNYFSKSLKNVLIDSIPVEAYFEIEEIRLRNTKRVCIKLKNREMLLSYVVTPEDIIETLELISENSIYSYQNQICNGYITIKGGHRVGITGNVAYEDNKVLNINYICSLNFRIAREIKGCSDDIFNLIYNKRENSIYNTLIVGKPSSGKTTLLRDLVRNISSNSLEAEKIGFNVGVIDERSEISAMYRGIPQNDLGEKTDILENVPKTIGIKMMIRSMAPDVIVADEIGGTDDSEVINYAICSGVKGLFTAHGDSIEALFKNPELNKLINLHLFERIIILSNTQKGKVSRLYRLDNMRYI